MIVTKLICDCGNEVELTENNEGDLLQNGLNHLALVRDESFIVFGDYNGRVNIRCNKCLKTLGAAYGGKW